jgi:hypothetical protein
MDIGNVRQQAREDRELTDGRGKVPFTLRLLCGSSVACDLDLIVLRGQKYRDGPPLFVASDADSGEAGNPAAGKQSISTETARESGHHTLYWGRAASPGMLGTNSHGCFGVSPKTNTCAGT